MHRPTPQSLSAAPAPRTAANNIIGRAGFTLVELMIVLAVLVMLVMLLAESAEYIRNQGAKEYTQDLIARVDAALSDYHARHGVWPPDRFSPGWIEPTDAHRPSTEGVEAMLACVGTAMITEQPRFARSLGDTDRDYNRLAHRRLNELLDGWGRPLLYYHGYGAEPLAPDPSTQPEAGRALPAFVAMPGQRMETLNASLRVRWTRSGRRPLLESAGPDGLFDTADDCRQDRGLTGPRSRPDEQTGE